MTEEIYKNGDTYYIKTLLGEIKMFDKDDNEINWIPTQNLGNKVIFYNQAYINEQTKRLEQENKKLSFAIEKCLENAGIECDDEEQALRSLTDLGSSHYKILLEKEKYRSALEEIRILATKNVSFENFVKIQNKINEVLQQKVDLGFWDKEGNYKEDIQKVDSKEL